jgi:hypothetical protein
MPWENALATYIAGLCVPVVGWVSNLCQTKGLSGLGTHLLATPVHVRSAPAWVTRNGVKAQRLH